MLLQHRGVPLISAAVNAQRLELLGTQLALLPGVGRQILRLNTHILIYHAVQIVVLAILVLFVCYFSYSFICISHSSPVIRQSLLEPIYIGILPFLFGNRINYVFNFIKCFEWQLLHISLKEFT